MKIRLALLIFLWGICPRPGLAARRPADSRTPASDGAEPAAMGGAYSALATNAHAPTVNPGGLGLVSGSELTAHRASLLDPIREESASFVYPLGRKSALGVAVRSFGASALAGSDEAGNAAGTFGARENTYVLAVGRSMGKKLSLGVAGKFTRAEIAGVSASALAADVGVLYKASERMTWAAVLADAGGGLKFIERRDRPPTAVRFGGAYRATFGLTSSFEVNQPLEGNAGLRFGLEWKPVEQITLRSGFRTDAPGNGSPLDGLTLGVGFGFLGQSFSYAWVPMGELGGTHLLSLSIRFKEFSAPLRRPR